MKIPLVPSNRTRAAALLLVECALLKDLSSEPRRDRRIWMTIRPDHQEPTADSGSQVRRLCVHTKCQLFFPGRHRGLTESVSVHRRSNEPEENNNVRRHCSHCIRRRRRAHSGVTNGQRSFRELVAKTSLPDASSKERTWTTFTGAVPRAHFTTHAAGRSVGPRECSRSRKSNPVRHTASVGLVPREWAADDHAEEEEHEWCLSKFLPPCLQVAVVGQ